MVHALKHFAKVLSVFIYFNLEVVMSFTRWVVSATFTGGLIAFSLQVGGIARSAPSSKLLIADSSSTSQNGQQNVPSGGRDAESSSKIQLDKDGPGTTDPNRIGGQIGTSSQRSDTDTPKTPGSRLTEKSGITGSGSDKPATAAPDGSSSSGISGGNGAGCCGK